MATINAIGSNKPIEVAFGGTGQATLTAHGVLLGNGTTGITQLAAAATGSTLMGSTGADPAFTGSPSFSGSVTAGTTITASSGAITATSGNFVATSGNLLLPTTTSSVGQIQINGTAFMHAYGTQNTFLGASSGNFTLTATSVTVIGRNAGNGLTNGTRCTLIGQNAGNTISSGTDNTAVGSDSLNRGTGVTGASNVSIGSQSGAGISSGSHNVAVGYSALSGSLTTGSYNIGIGTSAGSAMSFNGESSNILLNSTGNSNVSNRLKIGASTGTGNQQLNSAFIHGIRGITTGNADAINVLIDSAGQLGTVSSSIRFKENVQDLPDTRVLELRPVRFNYKQDGRIGTGLIAEEVEKVMPQLVAYNQEGECESVKYHDLPVLLLAEIQKLRKELDELKNRSN
jgi:hypothetical protein